MKKYLAIFALIFASTISTYGMNYVANDSDIVVVKFDKNKITWNGTERSLDYSIIEACAYLGQGIVEVSLYNIGSASVSLTPTVVYLDTFFTNGTYYIEIVSDTWYAEGVVTF